MRQRPRSPKRAICVGIILLAIALPAGAADILIPETKAERDARMAWWREARFGMFIHWGLYSIAAGEWNGKSVPGGGEWLMNTANAPVAEYERLAKRFNPVKYDPAAWVRLAKAAGMKYVVVTSKHHEGFCLFDTKATDYNMIQATPYGKDLLKPLAVECRKQGLKFCTYYSIMDWHHPAQYRNSPKEYDPTNIHPERKAEYIAFMKKQLKELLDTVSPEVLWFDGEWLDWWKEEDAVAVYNYLRKIKPSLIINNRLGTGREGMAGFDAGDRRYAGDFGTPEQEIPNTGLSGVDWESCMTMNGTWGFRNDDKNWKSVETLVRNIIDTASKGGNYLLNVGPTAEGEIPQASIERLEGIGRWMAVNGESIYGTTAGPFKKLDWGRCTRKTDKLYLHVYDWPKKELIVPGLKDTVANAYLLADPGKKTLTVSRRGDDVAIQIPEKAPDAIASVVVVNLKAAALEPPL
jgi:alpha-L-fucosidase